MEINTNLIDLFRKSIKVGGKKCTLYRNIKHLHKMYVLFQV